MYYLKQGTVCIKYGTDSFYSQLWRFFYTIAFMIVRFATNIIFDYVFVWGVK